MKTRKVLTFVAASAALALLLGGCGTSSQSSASNSQHHAQIITAWDSEPQNLLIPGNIGENAGGRVGLLVNSLLITFDEKGNPQNDLAESIEANADATQYTVKLKAGKKFSDGTPITAQSFVKAWSYTANAKNGQKCASFLSTIKGYDALQKDGLKGDEPLEGLKVQDDRTFTVDLSQPDSVFAIKVGYLAFAPLPEAFYKDPNTYGEKPISSGPYLLKSWDHNKQIELVKNKDYDGPRKAKNDGITFKIYTDPTAAYRDVQAGNLDVLDGVPPAENKTFQKDDSLKAYNRPGSVINTFLIHSKLKHFDPQSEEGRLRRQAISLSINRKLLVEKVLNNTARPATEFTSPLIAGYNDHLKGSENLSYNPKKAKELWQKADKISKYDDTFLFSYNADGGAAPVAEAVVNAIKNTLGIKAETAPVPTFKEYREAIVARQIKGAFSGGWMPDYPSAENYLTQVYASVAADGNGSNDSDYKNPEFDKLISQAASISDEKQANKLYQQAQEILLQDLPSIPLFYVNAKAVTGKTVQGFAMSWQNLPLYYQITK